MYKRLLCLLLGLMLCCLPALGEEELEMTNDEITRLLWEMYQTENGDIDYTVLPDDYQTPIEGKSGVYNLLLLGIDNPGSAITGRSDTMLLASLNARTGTLKLISFMRDTYVAIPHHGHNKLNAAYAYGGAELLLETLEASFGVQVDGYVAVNYQLMADLVDAIGGVELTVTKDEMKKLNGILEYYNRQREADRSEQLLTEYGDLRLTGLQTMSYARIRKLDSDFVRVERQQRVVQAIYRQLGTLDLMQLRRDDRLHRQGKHKRHPGAGRVAAFQRDGIQRCAGANAARARRRRIPQRHAVGYLLYYSQIGTVPAGYRRLPGQLNA